MPSPIDCSSTGTAVRETQAHDGLDREEHGSDEYDSEAVGSEENGSEEIGSEEYDRVTTNDEFVDKVNDEVEVTDEEDINGGMTDEHGDAEIADDGGDEYEQVEVGLLPRDNARRDRRDRRLCLLPLISCLFALAAVMYSAREPLPAYLAEPPQMPAWLANLKPARPEVLVPLDGAGSVRAIVELYEPFMGAGVGLLAARSWLNDDKFSLFRHTIPEADLEAMGGTMTFFGDLAGNISEFCSTVEIYSMPAGDEWRRNEELEGFCRPLVSLSRAVGTPYFEVAHGLTGSQQETRWPRRVMVKVLDLAHAAAGPDGPGHNLEGAADYLAANASTSIRLRRHVGPQGSWQAMNLNFQGELWRLLLSTLEVERMWAMFVPVARSFIDGTRATAAGDAGRGLLHAQAVGEWLQLESAVATVREIAIAAEDGIKALNMAQHRLQELYDYLGCVKQACLFERHGDDGDDGDKVRGRFVLADPSVLREELFGTAEWLEARMTHSDGDK
ncbi:hypothetical protein diail_6791 [Diaporthe ilicicola]|nr:hypothetical protein diail_6791 [Diaporthe ilicicola]